MLERIVRGFEIDREADSAVPIPAPAPRPGLELELEPSEIEVRLIAPDAELVRELTAVRPAPGREAEAGDGPAPLRRPATETVPSRPLSYTAISAYEECAYRFYMERVLNLTATEDSGGSGEPS